MRVLGNLPTTYVCIVEVGVVLSLRRLRVRKPSGKPMFVLRNIGILLEIRPLLLIWKRLFALRTKMLVRLRNRNVSIVEGRPLGVIIISIANFLLPMMFDMIINFLISLGNSSKTKLGPLGWVTFLFGSPHVVTNNTFILFNDFANMDTSSAVEDCTKGPCCSFPYVTLE